MRVRFDRYPGLDVSMPSRLLRRIDDGTALPTSGPGKGKKRSGKGKRKGKAKARIDDNSTLLNIILGVNRLYGTTPKDPLKTRVNNLN